MRAYLDLMQKILNTGETREDRTGTGTIGLFGEQLRIDLQEGFPLLTTKRVPFRSVVAELLWFLSGRTDVQSLREDGCTIWDEWATEEQCARFPGHNQIYRRKEGDLGPIYGWQWRNFGGDYLRATKAPFLPIGRPREIVGHGFDQIAWLIAEIKKNPFSRRLIVSAWNPGDAAVVALPPCHTLFQCCVQNAKPKKAEDCDACIVGYGNHTHEARIPRLSLHLYMRSADYFLGVPFNVASYALLTHLIARDCGLGVGELIVSFGDVHLYRNHLDQAREQLSREPRLPPTLGIIDAPTSILDYGWRKEHVHLLGYDPHPTIKAQVSV